MQLNTKKRTYAAADLDEDDIIVQCRIDLFFQNVKTACWLVFCWDNNNINPLYISIGVILNRNFPSSNYILLCFLPLFSSRFI
uniref:Uncharacterized protein n=1 Tax=Rhizophagus irregularis (strain DAOM 181602 / DAOM 197198 / MUCL 43194) TaxID=747089 RepID=U9TGG0_RHIID